MNNVDINMSKYKDKLDLSISNQQSSQILSEADRQINERLVKKKLGIADSTPNLSCSKRQS